MMVEVGWKTTINSYAEQQKKTPHVQEIQANY